MVHGMASMRVPSDTHSPVGMAAAASIVCRPIAVRTITLRCSQLQFYRFMFYVLLLYALHIHMNCHMTTNEAEPVYRVYSLRRSCSLQPAACRQLSIGRKLKKINSNANARGARVRRRKWSVGSVCVFLSVWRRSNLVKGVLSVLFAFKKKVLCGELCVFFRA